MTWGGTPHLVAFASRPGWLGKNGTKKLGCYYTRFWAHALRSYRFLHGDTGAPFNVALPIM
jgi:hypothetical protein